MAEAHDTYTFGPVARRWAWRCLTCGAVSETEHPKGFTRRMDADDSANDHIDKHLQESSREG